MAKNIIFFDFETSSTDQHICDAFQLAAVAIDQNKLKIIPDSLFNSWIRPDDIDDPNYYLKWKQTIDWHCGNFNCSVEEFIKKLKEAPPEKIAWESFINYLSKYHDRPNNQNMFSSPIPAGFNIIEFDFPILNRLCVKYKNVDKNGKPNIFYKRDVKDLLHITSLWLSPLEELKSLSMDSLRDYFNISRAGAHEASKDIKDGAAILLKFLGLHKRFSEQIKFKGAFANV